MKIYSWTFKTNISTSAVICVGFLWKHSFLIVYRVIIFTKENIQVKEQVMLRKTLSWRAISSTINSSVPMTKMYFSGEKSSRMGSNFSWNHFFLFTSPPLSENIRCTSHDTKIDFSESSLLGHKPIWNSQQTQPSQKLTNTIQFSVISPLDTKPVRIN